MVDKNEIKSRTSFLQRLRSDTAGNTIAMMGAALLPLAAMIGGGVDASRSYMVKARLQQACDAGVLAGRKAVGDGVFDQQANDRAIALFNANFPANYQSSKNTSFVASSPNAGGLVEGVASTELPTVIMRVFGYESVSLSAECNALLTISNADVTMVLDTTGSMTNNISDGNGGNTTRIVALRNAMNDFYSILDTASASSLARIRYGFIPYSGTVNVGALLTQDPANNYMMGQSSGDMVAYQSRRAVYEVSQVTGPVSETLQHTDGTPAYLTDGNCTNYGNNNSLEYWSVVFPSAFRHNLTASPSGNPVVDGDTTTSYQRTGWSGGYQFGDGTRILQCTRSVTTTTTTETYDGTLPGAVFKHWEHAQVNVPVTDYVATINGGNAAVPTSISGATARWAGCIEERNTVDSDVVAYDGGSNSINPGGALDLDIDSAPTDDASRWRPYWPEVMHFRDAGQVTQNFSDAVSDRYRFDSPSGGRRPQTACPVAAQELSTMTAAEFSAYANSLIPTGGTYHDLGMLWGARLSSPDGIFAANVNEDAPNNGFVSRHLIFMTDGVLDIGDLYYSAYGLELHDQRIGTGDEDQASINHITRFRAVCDAVRAKGIRLWVVAFATTLNADLTACASPNSAFVSTNAAELNQNFAEIAASIADLRLTE